MATPAHDDAKAQAQAPAQEGSPPPPHAAAVRSEAPNQSMPTALEMHSSALASVLVSALQSAQVASK